MFVSSDNLNKSAVSNLPEKQKIIQQKALEYFGQQFFEALLRSCDINPYRGKLIISSASAKKLQILENSYKKELELFCKVLWPKKNIALKFEYRPESQNFNFKKYKENGIISRPLKRSVKTNFSFNNFIDSSENIVSSRIAKSICSSEGIIDNSGGMMFYLQGESGTGKTHLSHAVHFHAAKLGINSLHFSSERFTAEYVNSARTNRIFDFKSKVQSADILIIDDFDGIVGKKKTFAELMRCISFLIDSGKSVMLTSSTNIRSLKTSDQQGQFLSSSILGSLGNASFELRQKIIASFVASNQMPIDNNAIKFLANNINRGGVRAVKGALQRLQVSAGLQDLTDLGNLKSLLSDLIEDNSDTNLSEKTSINMSSSSRKVKAKKSAKTNKVVKIDYEKNIKQFYSLLRSVIMFFNVQQQEIFSTKKSKSLAYIRGVIVFIAKDHLKISFKDIAKLMQKSSATVYNLHAKMTSFKSVSHDNIIASVLKILKTMERL